MRFINVLITADAELALLFIPGLVIITIGLVCGHVSLRKIRHSNGMLGGRRTSIGAGIKGISVNNHTFTKKRPGHTVCAGSATSG